MREEISEPQHWRRTTRGNSATGVPRPARRRSASPLPVEVVDAVFADESIQVEPLRGSRRDSVSHGSTHAVNHDSTAVSSAGKSDGSASRSKLVQSLSVQLAMLEAQREQLQHLLAQAGGEATK